MPQSDQACDIKRKVEEYSAYLCYTVITATSWQLLFMMRLFNKNVLPKYIPSDIQLRYYLGGQDFSGCTMCSQVFKDLYDHGVRDFRGVKLTTKDFQRKNISGCLLNDDTLRGANTQWGEVNSCVVGYRVNPETRRYQRVYHGQPLSKNPEIEHAVFLEKLYQRARKDGLAKVSLTAGELHYLRKRGIRNFSGAIINDQCLDGMDLSNCDFSGADLTGSSFKKANCSYANFSGAILDRTCFLKAICKKTLFLYTRYDALVEDSFLRAIISKIDTTTPESTVESCWTILRACYERRGDIYMFFCGRNALQTDIMNHVNSITDKKSLASIQSMLVFVAGAAIKSQSSELSRSLSLIVKLLAPTLGDGFHAGLVESLIDRHVSNRIKQYSDDVDGSTIRDKKNQNVIKLIAEVVTSLDPGINKVLTADSPAVTSHHQAA